MKRVMIDSDVILDAAVNRASFAESSKAILAAAENGQISGVVSGHCITNVYYILKKISSKEKTRKFIEELIAFLFVVPFQHNAVVNALQSDFSDFEDGVLHFCAVHNQSDCIVTRNVNDYTASALPVYTPNEFIHLYLNHERK